MKSCPTCKTTYPGRFSVCPQDGVALVESSEWLMGTVIRGKYRILGKIGQGGMGSVYKASHVVFDELRALKVINPELTGDDHFLKRFKQEAIIARRLDHPNAVRVDDIDESETGLPFIVMEYLEGRSLKDLIEKEAPLSTGRACAIVRQVAAALGAAHGLGMVHRDVKPANVMIVNTPSGEQAKVLDFGIAKAKEARSADSSGMTLTGTGIVTGTPQYMSPEQALGKRSDQLDGRSDLYSLGVMMYQMLTGDLPFKADTTMQMLLAHINTPPRPLLEVRPESGISPALARVVMRCLEKDPGRRPSSGAELIAELDDAEAASSAEEQAEPSMTATRLASPPAAPFSSPKGVTPPPPYAGPASSQAVAEEVPPQVKKTGFKGILAAVIAAIVVIGVIGMVWGLHRFRSPAHNLAPAAAPAPQQTTQSPAPPPSGNLQQTSTPNPAETAETTVPPAASKMPEITGPAATAQPQLRESASASKRTSTPPRALTQPAQKQAAPAQTAAVLPPKVTPSGPVPSPPPAIAAATNPELATVIVSTAPGAQIFVDGKHAGTANSSGRLTLANLAPGSHDLRAALSGFNDIGYTIRVPPGGTSFVSAKWGASLSAAPTQPSTSQTGAATAKGIAVSFPVAYLRTFGSSRGLLVIEGGNVHYQPSDGKGAFFSPLSGITWGSSGSQEFYIRVKGGQNYRFRSPEAANILATLRRAVSEQ